MTVTSSLTVKQRYLYRKILTLKFKVLIFTLECLSTKTDVGVLENNCRVRFRWLCSLVCSMKSAV